MPAPSSPDLIALFTDFGVGSHYLGQMKAALYGRRVYCPIVELCSDAPAFDPISSSYLLGSFLDYLPAGSLIIAVVDPGVGSDRRAILVKSERHWLLGPDNGLLAIAVQREKNVRLQTITLEKTNGSRTFDGRDLFAPAAAMLCQNEVVPGVEIQASSLIGIGWPVSVARIIYIDTYGNAVSGMAGDTVSKGQALRVNGVDIVYAATFSRVQPGCYFWYVNSNNLVEISVNSGSAADLLELGIGTRIEIVT